MRILLYEKRKKLEHDSVILFQTLFTSNHVKLEIDEKSQQFQKENWVEFRDYAISYKNCQIKSY